MIWRSLKWRLFFAASIFIVSALVIYWSVLTSIFERHVSGRLYGELEAHLNRLTAIVEVTPDNELLVEEELASVRFNRIFGGLYWQISSPEFESINSRSLWDQSLQIPGSPTKPGVLLRIDGMEFNGGKLLAVERTILILAGEKEHRLRIITAMDRSELEKAIVSFDADVARLVSLLALFLVVAAGAQIIIGLRPLSVLREKLNQMGAVSAGQKSVGLQGNFPTEVNRLVEELNSLLRERSELVDKARARASDLAHGLKTPLAILAAESRSLKNAGQNESASEISTQIDTMNRHVERQLVAARMGSTSATSAYNTPLRPLLQKFVRMFEKLSKNRNIKWQLRAGEALSANVDQMDLEEILGNLFDNASKWARRVVNVRAHDNGKAVTIIVSDDGAGVPDNELGTILERGRRLDEAMSGSGLGLAIVSDIVEAYGGRLHLDNSDLGGLEVRVEFPK